MSPLSLYFAENDVRSSTHMNFDCASSCASTSSEFSLRSSISTTSSIMKKRGSKNYNTSKGDRYGRKVSFYKSVKVHPVLHLKDYTKEEFCATWCSKSEIAAIRQAIYKTIKEMEAISSSSRSITAKTRGQLHNQFRGLEFRTRKGKSMKGESRKLANSIVLQEQERQRKSGICDQDYLALLYKQQSRLSIVMAQEIAMDDEEYINIAEQ